MNRVEEAGKKFAEIVGSNQDQKGLIRVKDAGWAELIPERECWTFMHPDYMGILVRWFFDREAWYIQARGDVDEDGHRDIWNGEQHSYWPEPQV